MQSNDVSLSDKAEASNNDRLMRSQSVCGNQSSRIISPAKSQKFWEKYSLEQIYQIRR